jgi:hypothetical protein
MDTIYEILESLYWLSVAFTLFQIGCGVLVYEAMFSFHRPTRAAILSTAFPSLFSAKR